MVYSQNLILSLGNNQVFDTIESIILFSAKYNYYFKVSIKYYYVFKEIDLRVNYNRKFYNIHLKNM